MSRARIPRSPRTEVQEQARRRRRRRQRRDNTIVAVVAPLMFVGVLLVYAMCVALPWVLLALVLHWLGAF